MKSTHTYYLATAGAIVLSTLATGSVIAGTDRPLLAQANPVDSPEGGWYGGLGIGYSSPSLSSSTQINILGIPATVNTNLTGDSSLGYNGFVGYKMKGGFRGEGELFYTNSRITGASASGTGFGLNTPSVSVGANGSVSNLAVMLNGYYDFGTGSKFTPYVGAGIGYGSTNVTSNATVTIAGNTIPVLPNNPSSSGFAYQVKAGVGYALTERNDLYLQYRYLNTGGGVNASLNSFELGTKLNF
jgi:opacity protein-like surface antigen